MSNRPLHSVQERLHRLLEAARQLGCTLEDPFMTLSFMALPVIPELKITDRGIFDGNRFAHVPLFCD
jgi:adenine deaminase